VSVADRLEALVAGAALGALDGFGWRAALRVGAALGGTVRVLGIRRRVALENLARAFPERSEAERVALLDAHYREMGRIAAEYGRIGPLVRAPQGEVLARIDREDLLRSLVGRGAVVVSGHYGNFELGAAICGRFNPIDFLVKPLSNERVDERVTRLRRDAGVGIISTRGGVKQVFKALRAGRWIAMAADQDAGRHGVFVPFFGRLASTAEGPARFALQARVPMIVGGMRRLPDGRHVLGFSDVREPEGEPSEANVLALTAWHTAMLEARVREAPEQYFWLHRRWKTRPPGENAT